MKETEKRTDNHIPEDEPILFFEVTPGDASEFSGVLQIHGEQVDGHKILRTVSPAVPNAIAAFLLSCGTKPVSYLTPILAGAKVTRCPIY